MDIEEKYKNESIDVLDLSTRAYNCLKRNNINTIFDLVRYPKGNFFYIKNLGQKTLDEILACIENIINDDIDMICGAVKSEEELKIAVHPNGQKYQDVLINKLELSIRAINFLQQSGYKWLSEIISLDYQDFISIKNLGSKTAKEILEFSENYNFESIREGVLEEKVVTPDLLCNEFFIIMNKELKFDYIEYSKNLIPIYTQYLETCKFSDINMILSDQFLVETICHSAYVSSKLQKLIMQSISNYKYGCDYTDLLNIMPRFLKRDNLLEEIIEELINNYSIIKNKYNKYMINYLSCIEGSKSVLSEKEHIVLVQRIEGKTLEEIGCEFNVTRSRIQQIENKVILKMNNNNLIFQEDVFFDIFNQYQIFQDDFVLAFKDEKIYNYLDIRYNKIKITDKKPLIEILNDEEIPEYFKKSLKKAIYKNYVKLGSRYILLNKSEIMKYVLQVYSDDIMTYDEFFQLYLIVIEDLGKSDDSKLNKLDRGIERLADSEIALKNFNKQFRYYNIEGRDYDDLLNKLNLNQYVNFECSAKLFFILYPELMLEYDIRDEYELHNLLKKLSKTKNITNIHFGKMPSMIFGTSNRNSQVLNLLIQLAPISNIDFARAYENEYGVSAATVLANYMKEFDEYFYDGIYKIDAPMLPTYMASELKNCLTDDFYLLDEVNEIYKKIFKGADMLLLNPFSLKSLGFKVYSTYMVSDKYNSATQYFNYLLINQDVFNIRDIPNKIRQLGQFSAHLYKLQAQYALVEFTANKYISYERLSKNGISIDEINSFNDAVYQFAGEGKYFTITSLRNEGFYHDLEDFGFDEWFYSSLLCECKDKLSHLRIGGNRLFMSGKERVEFSYLIENIVYSQENLSINIYDLKEFFETTYAIAIHTYNLVQYIKGTNMFYDDISEKVYAEYDIYYEEI